MNKDQKNEVVELLKGKFSQYNNFYITNTESLSVAQVNHLRKVCFDKNVEMKVAKNTLIKKALESLDNEKYAGIYEALNGVTALMFSDSPKEPALIISTFRKENAKLEKPVLKAAFVADEVYLGDNQLANLVKIKTRNELIGEVIGLLQSPAKRVIAALLEKGNKEGGAVAEAPAAPDAPSAPEAPAAPDAPAAE